MEILTTPMISISELKREPMKAFAQAKENHTGTYILNNNKPVAVVLDPADYERLVVQVADLMEALFDAKIEAAALERIRDVDRELISADEVMGIGWQQRSDDNLDEWE